MATQAICTEQLHPATRTTIPVIVAVMLVHRRQINVAVSAITSAAGVLAAATTPEAALEDTRTITAAAAAVVVAVEAIAAIRTGARVVIAIVVRAKDDLQNVVEATSAGENAIIEIVANRLANVVTRVVVDRTAIAIIGIRLRLGIGITTIAIATGMGNRDGDPIIATTTRDRRAVTNVNAIPIVIIAATGSPAG